ncbi:2',3'-cyclic-nucleotide 2'-phosphodiesterase / 3'-nucleotidase [Alkalibacterium subtropicum]|uniref:2',3'-cyclic-nucleotide 2'-phosphodiesterase / 3'-nucleotidase n=1 Tax=Alkalibacterium subtropicum TaxID=753702 RepID=A0A1I1HEF4_9LACT|nr:bifunctional UDP-sugar hydrolase/5'-nucleotidase [Alkalibacterium subtropicum]SFC22075.1 2',3'-cyclic-nucleotide 2'-phosphodiesterase / 3'-nucleotidase [Alkalibacterium subtropicum]
MKLTLFETSDIHGYVYPTDYQSRFQDAEYGLLKLAALLKRERNEAMGFSLAIENGDLIQGSPFTHYLVKHKHSAGALMNIVNDLQFDAGVIGNHEFNYGLDYLESAVVSAAHPVLCANVLTSGGKTAFGEPYKIFNKQGIKVAVLGLTTQYIPHWEHPENYAGLTFESAVKTAKTYVPLLKEKADIVVVSYHGGFEKDLHTGQPTETLTGENEGYAILSEVPGIDVLLAGHQHRLLAEVVNGTAVVMPGSKGAYLGKVVMDLEKEKGKVTIKTMEAELLSVKDAAIDKQLAAEYSWVNDEVEDWLDQPIGHVKGDMSIDDVEQARKQEHPYIEFIHRVQMYYSDCDISGTALFNNRVKGFSDSVTMRDVVLNYIYPNTLAVLNVSGQDLKAALEQSASYFSLNSENKLVVNPEFMNPKPQMYNYDMFEGIDYVIDVARPEGERITTFKYRGKDIKPDDRLDIVINQYRAVGGGNYGMFDAGKIKREVTIPMNELIGDYFAAFSPIKAEVNNNFKVISSR